MKQAIEEIKQIADLVSENWVADDGGLTMAASDVISFADSCIAAIKRNDVEWVWALDPFTNNTGAESDIVTAAHGWARRKFRRRIEDRLRKSDYTTLHKVGKLLGLSVDDGWKGCESNYSGQSIPTRFGNIDHTNGHFALDTVGKIFWFKDFPKEIAHQTYAGSPECCGYAKFHIPRLEAWFKARGYHEMQE